MDALDRRQVVLVTLAATFFATAILGGWFNRAFLLPDPATWQKGRLVASTYDPPDQVIELFHNQGDGQVYAHEAQDPFVQHPEAIKFGPDEQAYRLQRPLYGWAGWLASVGDPDLVGWSLIWVTMASVALLGTATALACRQLGRSPLWGLLILAAPGVSVNLLRCGPEALATALAAAGFLAWTRPDRRPWLAVACFALAGLARESFLLVPVTLLVVDWWLHERRAGPFLRGASRAVRSPLSVSLVPYLAWVLVLRVGLGAWPKGTVEGRLSIVPYGGLVAAFGRMGHEEVISLALILVPAVLALVFGTDRRLRALVAVHLLMAATFGETIWFTWLGFGRVLLPLSLFSLLALCSARASRPPLAPEPVAEATREPALAP